VLTTFLHPFLIGIFGLMPLSFNILNFILLLFSESSFSSIIFIPIKTYQILNHIYQICKALTQTTIEETLVAVPKHTTEA
jgi:hypothetical protein